MNKSAEIKTLSIRKRELNNKLLDIETIWPDSYSCPKHVLREYNDLYVMFRETCDQIELLEGRVKRESDTLDIHAWELIENALNKAKGEA